MIFQFMTVTGVKLSFLSSSLIDGTSSSMVPVVSPMLAPDRRRFQRHGVTVTDIS